VISGCVPRHAILAGAALFLEDDEESGLCNMEVFFEVKHNRFSKLKSLESLFKGFHPSFELQVCCGVGGEAGLGFSYRRF